MIGAMLRTKDIFSNKINNCYYFLCSSTLVVCVEAKRNIGAEAYSSIPFTLRAPEALYYYVLNDCNDALSLES
jgi:hypothetical protein